MEEEIPLVIIDRGDTDKYISLIMRKMAHQEVTKLKMQVKANSDYVGEAKIIADIINWSGYELQDEPKERKIYTQKGNPMRVIEYNFRKILAIRN